MEGSGGPTLDLIRRIKGGDPEAFSPLFSAYRRRLTLLVHYKLGRQLAQFVSVRDIVQETMLRAYRDFQKFDYSGPESLLHWLSRIADHVIADQARYADRGKRRFAAQVRFRSLGTPSGPDPADSRIPSRIVEDQEALVGLIRDLDRLPDEYRRILILARIEGLSVSAIAERVGRSPNAVSILLHRAIKRFREIRESKGKGSPDE